MISSNNYITYNNTDLMFFSNKDTRVQKNNKLNNNVQNNNIKIDEFKIKNCRNNDVELSITGDRFIPYKNNLDNNIQNFILNSSPFNNNLSSSKNKKDSFSSLEGKPEKNYVNFIIDNMLKNSSEKYVIKNNNKMRQNRILNFSKSIYRTTYKNKKRTLFNKDLNTLKNNLNFSAKKNNNNFFEDDSIFEFNNDINNEMITDITNITEYNKKRIINPNNDLYEYNNMYNKIYRKIQKTPIRILDAPNLIDDFYLNILDWGNANIIAVGLSDDIYLWNDNNSETSLLMTYKCTNSDIDNNNISSLSFMNNGICLGVGLPNGFIQLWDINKKIKIREIEAHEDRVSCLSWNEYMLSSGSKDRYIKNFDVRNKYPEISQIKKHKQEICSLKYSNEGDLLASGGNDNVVFIWDIRNIKNNIYNFSFDTNNNEIKPYAINNFHQAAIKAMAWCPWKRHVLATGGGSADKSIKVYSCDCNKLLKNIDTGSQVCALIWNKKEKEIISSHGYNKNQIIIWNYEKNKKICELKGHMNRVLYLTMSSDENEICSGSGDETLRFWKINDDKLEKKDNEDIKKMVDNVIVH